VSDLSIGRWTGYLALGDDSAFVGRRSGVIEAFREELAPVGVCRSGVNA
jgi:hypothetical protein